jgi:hypothetical protein
MIKETKDILQAVVEQRTPNVTVVRSVKEEKEAIMARKFPLVALVTNQGHFDDRDAKKVRYKDEEAETWKERYIRGSRILPILLRCWSKGENEADAVFSRILPAIPRRWELDGFEGTILISIEEHSDHSGNMAELYVSVVEVQFTVPVALEETIVPTISQVQNET